MTSSDEMTRRNSSRWTIIEGHYSVREVFKVRFMMPRMTVKSSQQRRDVYRFKVGMYNEEKAEADNKS